jgi:hypothetical protein
VLAVKNGLAREFIIAPDNQQRRTVAAGWFYPGSFLVTQQLIACC